MRFASAACGSGVTPLPGEGGGPHRRSPPVTPPLDEALVTGGWPRGALAVLDAAPGHPAPRRSRSMRPPRLPGCRRADGVDRPRRHVRPGLRRPPRGESRVAAPVRPRQRARGPGAGRLAGPLPAPRPALVLDLGERAVPDRRALDRLASLLARSESTSALVLAPAGRAVAGVVAGVRVALHRTAWLGIGRDLVGQRVHASVERHRWALAGGSAELDLWFGEGRRLDPLVATLAEPQSVEGIRGTAGAAGGERLT